MARRQSLSVEVAQDIKEKIQRAKLAPGNQIPTEGELCNQYEVSRTVIREAIASLRSEGLLISRQGVGVFVAEDAGRARFELDWDAVRTLPETIALLEMRMALEVEAAGLCALRRTADDAKTIRSLMENTDRMARDPETSKMFYDFDFHLAIAAGAKNTYILQFMTFLGPIITPRVRLRLVMNGEPRENYADNIKLEHEDVVSAIENENPELARAAMRAHLLAGLDRVRLLAESFGVGALAAPRPGIMRNFVESIV